MAANPDENSKNNEQNQHEFIAPKPVSGDVLRAEEEKLKAKYQLPNNWKGSGHSAFLQKKLAKGQKYFDSGDYQMAKQTSGIPKIDRAVPQPLLKFATGDAIPTPDTVPARKTSIIQPKFTPNTFEKKNLAHLEGNNSISSFQKLQKILELMAGTIVQYILVRGDLAKAMGWPLGAIIAQACHASVAVTHEFYADEHTKQYLQDVDSMHKVVLEVPNEEELKKVHNLLTDNQICHKMWVEQPENICTCLAVKPYPKNDVQKYFKKYKLLN